MRRLFPLLILVAAGCGTTRMTDTTRAASEMMLISQAIDVSVGRLDFTELNGQPVFLDTQYLDGVVDRGYLISSLRQQLLAHGASLAEEKKKATYVLEARSGGVGTDKHSLLIGTPAMSLPAVVPGIPSSIPEIALMKKTDQKGIAKIAVFAYNRETGRALWQSGLVDATSTLKDTWVLGVGPISRGTVRQHTELAGETLPAVPSLPFGFGSPEAVAKDAPVPGEPMAFPDDLPGAAVVSKDKPAGAVVPAGSTQPAAPVAPMPKKDPSR